METLPLMSAYVAFLRALYLIHQEGHWKAKEYGNHLLFQRLYEGIQESADEAAERVIGLFGDIPNQTELINEIKAKFTAENHIENSLRAEKGFLDLSKKTYNQLKDNNAITLGLDDLIMSLASKSEVHVYLLQQALKT